MSQFADWLLWELGRTTLWLALVCALVAAVLRLGRVTSPTLHRVAWCVALLAGWALVRMPIEVPWYPAEAAVASPLETELLDVDASVPAIEDVPPTQLVPFSLDSPLAAPPTSLPPAKEAPTWSPPRWPHLTILAWIVGMLAIIVVWVCGYLWFVLRLPKGREVEEAWNDEWRSLQTGQGRARPIPLRVTSSLGPLLCRLPRGYELLVPEALWRKLSPAERRAILCHELAHWRRGDVWKSLAARVLALPHWFNPASWLAVRRFDEAAEWACDSAATAGEPTAYAKILMRVGELAARRTRYGAALRGRALAARIRRLVSLGQKEDSAMKKAILIIVVACLAASALVRVQLVAQEPDKPPPAKTPRETDSIPIFFGDDPSPPAAIDAPSKPSPPAKPSPSLRKAEQDMLTTAQKAYEAALAAYQAGNATLDSVYVWSSRWLGAELAVGRKQENRTAAATAHLERMRQLQTNIKKLYEVGTRGGEALEMSAANFYVAEAERKLAELKANLGTMRMQSSSAPTAYPAATYAPAEAARTPVAGPVVEQPTAVTVEPKANSKIVDLRYDDKSFDQWTTLLRTELSLQRRSEAVRAIGEFGAHGLGAQAAAAILDAVGEQTITDNISGVFFATAVAALRKIPTDQAIPAALERLKSGNGLQRLFILQRVPNLPADALPLLFVATKDESAEIRTSALLHIAFLGHDSPKLPDALRAALKSHDRDEVVTAIRLAGGAMVRRPAATVSATLAPFPPLVPELIGLLNDADGKLRGEAANALELIGPAAVPALEKAAANPDTGKAAQEVLDQIQNPGKDKQIDLRK